MDLRVGSFILFVWMSVWWLDSEIAFYTISLLCWDLRSVMCLIESWTFRLGHRSEHRSVCVGSISPLIFLSIHPVHPEILMVWGEIHRFTCKSLDKSSDFINLWIYRIYLRTLIFHHHLLYYGIWILLA